MAFIRAIGVGFALVAACASVAEDSAESRKLFDDLFGAEIARVERTPSSTDDVELAGRLFDAVETAADKPALVKVLCETTVRLASKDATGMPTAIAAQERLVDMAGANPGPAVTKLLDLRYQQLQMLRGEERREAAIEYIDAALDGSERMEEAGDVEGARDLMRTAQRAAGMTGQSETRLVVGDRLRVLGSKLAAISQAETLKKRLKANPADAAAAKDLINIYVVDLDDPAEAFKYSMLVDDKQLQSHVKTATLEVDEVAPESAMDAAAWYLGLTESAREQSVRLNLLERSAALYDRYIESDAAKGLRLTKAELDRKKVQGEIEKIEAAIAKAQGRSGGPWVDVFKKIDLNDYPSSAWSRKGKAVISKVDDDEVLDFEVRPEGSYEFRVKLARVDGPGHIGLIFAVPGRSDWSTCTFVCQGADGEYSGLERVDGRTFARNPSTGRGGWLPAGKTVTVRVVVKVDGNEVEVTGYVGSSRKTKWKGTANRLSNHWSGTSGNLGVVADYSKVAVVSAEYRSLDGK